jgi:hypothetical protein
MILREGAKKGSVGRTTRLNGKRVVLTWGYQVRMMRKINRKIMTPNKGPRVQKAISTTVIVDLSLKEYKAVSHDLSGVLPLNFSASLPTIAPHPKKLLRPMASQGCDRPLK